MNLYNKEYAEKWIKNEESKLDKFRTNFLEPFLKQKIQETNSNSKILDVGCGHGVILEFISKQEYWGIERTKDFLDYIKRKYKDKKLHLLLGVLPNKINVPKDYFA